MKPATSLFLFVFVILFFSCDKLEDKKRSEILPENNLYILCEGLFNYNNSTLAYYSKKEQTLDRDFFATVNNRGLGETANDMQQYGGKIYIVSTGSSCVEVIDATTGISIKQIAMFGDAEKKNAQQPRNIAFFDDKAYVCSFDGSLTKIDTVSLEIEAVVMCGKNPDGLCIANRKVYVSNSGGLSAAHDNTVSVIDIDTFEEIKKIEVAENPYTIMAADNETAVFVSTRGGDNNQYLFHKIDTRTDELVKTYFDIEAYSFTMHNDTAYLYNYNFFSKELWIKVFDCRTEKIVSENFIQDETLLQTPYNIQVHPTTGDVYISDVFNFVRQGDVLCFGRDGRLKFRLQEVGLNPKTFIFKE